MSTKVLGLDISRNFAIGFLLEEFPKESPLKCFNEEKKTLCHRLDNNQKGIDVLKSLNPDIIILEPTGFWYSEFWVHQARLLKIQVYWVSHQEVKYHRRHYGFKNKDDDSDAFTIACMWHDPGARDELGNPRILRNYEYEVINRMRSKFLEREQLDKRNTAAINQLKQRLALEFPEICQRDLCEQNIWGFNPTLGHITEQETNKGIYKNRKFPKTTAGIGLSEYSKILARDIIREQSRMREIEEELETIIGGFPEYNEIFKEFHYGTVLKSLILMYCYPIDRFFVNGKPYRRKGQDVSLRKFQAFMGMSFSYEKSGDSSAKQGKIKKKWHGSDMVRNHLYAHALVTICNPKSKARSKVMINLKEAWFNERLREIDGKVEKLPSLKSLGKDGICRLLFYETRLLYQSLKNRTT